MRRMNPHPKDLRNVATTGQQSAHGDDAAVSHSDQKLTAYVKVVCLDVVEVAEVGIVLKRLGLRSCDPMQTPDLRPVGRFNTAKNQSRFQRS